MSTKCIENNCVLSTKRWLSSIIYICLAVSIINISYDNVFYLITFHNVILLRDITLVYFEIQHVDEERKTLPYTSGHIYRGSTSVICSALGAQIRGWPRPRRQMNMQSGPALACGIPRQQVVATLGAQRK